MTEKQALHVKYREGIEFLIATKSTRKGIHNMATFNKGNPYHGSEAVMGGGLKGTTDTDYFYFFCPRCPDNHVLRLLDYGVHVHSATNEYDGRPDIKSKCAKGFVLAFQLYCEGCGLRDFVKVGNGGQQYGSLPLKKEAPPVFP